MVPQKTRKKSISFGQGGKMANDIREVCKMSTGSGNMLGEGYESNFSKVMSEWEVTGQDIKNLGWETYNTYFEKFKIKTGKDNRDVDRRVTQGQKRIASGWKRLKYKQGARCNSGVDGLFDIDFRCHVNDHLYFFLS